MTTRDFAFWLQGFFEISDTGEKTDSNELNHQQVTMIRDHLNLVFKHEFVQKEVEDPRKEPAIPTSASSQIAAQNLTRYKFDASTVVC